VCLSSSNPPNAFRLNTSKRDVQRLCLTDGDVTSCGSRWWNFLKARVHGSARSLGKYDGGLNSCASASSKVYSVSLSPKAICIGDIIPSTHPHFVHSLSPSPALPRATTSVYPQRVPTALSLDHPTATSRTPLAHPRLTSERLEISGIGLVVVHPRVRLGLYSIWTKIAPSGRMGELLNQFYVITYSESCPQSNADTPHLRMDRLAENLTKIRADKVFPRRVD